MRANTLIFSVDDSRRTGRVGFPVAILFEQCESGASHKVNLRVGVAARV